MCNVYNSTGSLTTILSHLKKSNINDFNSLDQIIEFKKTYITIRQTIISESEITVRNERSTLLSEIFELNKSISDKKSQIEQSLIATTENLKFRLASLSLNSNKTIDTIRYNFRKSYLKLKIHVIDLTFNTRVHYSVFKSAQILKRKNKRYQYVANCFTDAVDDICLPIFKRLDKKKKIIDELENHIYGAIGEQKVVAECEKLSNEYYLINDFSIKFPKAIYNPFKKYYIKSIQIDHILVSPAGIFLIETKNWSDDSIENLSFRSPIEQIDRANFALYRILSKDANSSINLLNHHWGKKKIPIRNTLVMIRNKPHEEFQFVKVLSLSQLIRYIEYFDPIFSTHETQQIANFLVNLSIQKFWKS